MSDPSSLMGPLLLKGWAMSAECCEIDGVPLMKDKRANCSICCACETRLAKYIVDGCQIVTVDNKLFVQNASMTVNFLVKKEDGVYKFVGEVEKVEAIIEEEALEKEFDSFVVPEVKPA